MNEKIKAKFDTNERNRIPDEKIMVTIWKSFVLLPNRKIQQNLARLVKNKKKRVTKKKFIRYQRFLKP